MVLQGQTDWGETCWADWHNTASSQERSRGMLGHEERSYSGQRDQVRIWRRGPIFGPKLILLFI